jgi:hypothetical protein
MDDGNAYGGSNGGLAQRYAYTRQIQIFDLEGPLYTKIFFSWTNIHAEWCRYQPKIISQQSTSACHECRIVSILQGRVDRRVIHKACMIKVDSGVLINHLEILKEMTAKYPLIRTEVKMNTCTTGSGSFIWQNVSGADPGIFSRGGVRLGQKKNSNATVL